MDSSDSSYYSRQQLDELFLQMIAFFSGDPKRIQHFMKVHSFARIIGTKEGLDETSLFILEAAAYTHDIGIRPAEEKYGRCDGKLQEQEGPIVAQRMLSDVGIENYGICAETAFTYEKEEAKNLLPQRKTSGHKGTFGKVLLYAGSREMSGAALLCARAVLCSGAGMLKVLTEETNHTLLRTVLPEAMIATDPVKDLEWADVLVAGPGIGTSEEAKETLTGLLRASYLPTVLDADALNLLAEENGKELAEKLRTQGAEGRIIILTPHVGELSRLLAKTIPECKKELPAASS